MKCCLNRLKTTISSLKKNERLLKTEVSSGNAVKFSSIEHNTANGHYVVLVHIQRKMKLFTNLKLLKDLLRTTFYCRISFHRIKRQDYLRTLLKQNFAPFPQSSKKRVDWEWDEEVVASTQTQRWLVRFRWRQGQYLKRAVVLRGTIWNLWLKSSNPS